MEDLEARLEDLEARLRFWHRGGATNPSTNARQTSRKTKRQQEVEMDLLVACRKGDNQEVVRLLDGGLDVNSIVEEATFRDPLKPHSRCRVFEFANCTALHVAIYFRQTAVVATLLGRGANVGLAAERIAHCVQSRGGVLCREREHLRATALHLSVVGADWRALIYDKESGLTGIDQKEFYLKMRQTIALVVRHLWRRLQLGKLDKTHDASLVRGIVERKATARIRSRKPSRDFLRDDYLQDDSLEDATALHMATYFTEGLDYAVVGKNEAMDDLLDLVQASTTSTLGAINSSLILDGIFPTLLYKRCRGPIFTTYQLKFYANQDVSKLARGYRSAWRKQVHASLGAHIHDACVLLEILKFAQISSTDLIVDVLQNASQEERALYLEEALDEETQLLKLVLDRTSDLTDMCVV